MTKLSELEERRAAIVEEMGSLGDLRRGSLSERTRPCGKPNCRCKQPGSPGHGPTYSFTYKVAGKSRMETIPPDRLDEVRRQLENRQRFAELSKQFLEVNEEICRHRSLAKSSEESAAKKKTPGGNRRGSLAGVRPHLEPSS
jgi:hypothetical protein